MESLHLLVEFGGGYGDVVAMAREMGFRGTHVVYDLLPALLLQQYFHHTSNWPSYLLVPSEAVQQQGQEQGLPKEGQGPIQKCISNISNRHLITPSLDGDDNDGCCVVHEDEDDGELIAVLDGKTVMVPASTPRAMMTGVRRTTRTSSSSPGTSTDHTTDLELRTTIR